MDSILNHIKKLLGISSDYTHFDTDIIVHINSTLWRLRQLGVKDEKVFKITSGKETWTDFFGDSNEVDLEAVKTYIYLKVKTIFDPPTSSFVLEAMKQQIAEYEWCLNVEAENESQS